MEDLWSTRVGSRKRAREDEVLDQLDPVVSADAKRQRDDLLLGFFDGTDPKPAAQGFDSHSWIFQEEISTASTPTTEEEVVDLRSESGWSEELGCPIWASDDLGIPPCFQNDVIDDLWSREAELACAPYGRAWGLEGLMDVYDVMGPPSYGSYDGDEGYEHVVFDGGLFGYSDVRFDTSDDLSDLGWQSGS